MKPDGIGVDVGNSRIKCWPMGSGHEPAFEISIRDIDWLEKWSTWRQTFGHTSLGWWIASVQADVTARLLEQLHGRFPADTVRVLTADDIPIRTALDCRKQVGVDRLLSSWAGWCHAGSAVIVADAGSALTVDWTDTDGVFRGGAILPGLEVQLTALSQQMPALAAAVGDVQCSYSSDLPEPIEYPGTNTRAAIAAGIFGGATATIESFVVRISNQTGKPVRLMLTGGDAQRLSPLVNHPHDVLPNLIQQGICRIATESPDQANLA